MANSRKQTKKRNFTKKTLSKKSKYKTKKKNNKNTYPLYKKILLVLLVSAIIFLIGYGYRVYSENPHSPQKVGNEYVYPSNDDALLKALFQIKKREEQHKEENISQKKSSNKNDKALKKRKSTIVSTGAEASHKTLNKKKELKKREKKENLILKKTHNKKLAYRGNKAKLVIIIDDVHTRAQIKMIQALPYDVTPSIFPPYSLAKHSETLSRGLKHHYMIHLPMESGSTQFNKQSKTLMRTDDAKKIKSRIEEIRRLFPDCKYINNHTGSVFTADYQAMKRLYILLRQYGFTFIDSFTTASSKVKKIAHALGDDYVRRDIFIDNKLTKKAIRRQLKKAVKIAKKKGYAIAIGHPHKTTMQALLSSQQILKEVEIVYIDNIYKK